MSKPTISTPVIACRAISCTAVGHARCPSREERKSPKLPGWQKLRLKSKDVPVYFGENANVGVLLGEPSCGLVDVDLDAKQTCDLAGAFLPATNLVHGRASRPHSHHWYVVDPPLRPEKFADVDGSCLVEIRSTGQQTVVPPSIHPSGEIISWENEGEPSLIAGAEIRKAVAQLAAAALLVRHYPAPGGRHEATLALSSVLLQHKWSEDCASRFVTLIAKAACDEEASKRTKDVLTTAQRIIQGTTVSGRGRLIDILGRQVEIESGVGLASMNLRSLFHRSL